ncbi:hypothetical protein [Actinoplanes sp. CA-252034]|uniref:hypothetical protein n=1 Tax=Actinoplanes sp. CA-252034 TaxID=3239906 RepID=UPI003D985D38
MRCGTEWFKVRSGGPAGWAVADLLLGVANPSGRLAETLPVRLQDIPSYLNFPSPPPSPAVRRTAI